MICIKAFPVIPNVFYSFYFSDLGSKPSLHIKFSCLLVCFNMDRLLGIYFSFMTLKFWTTPANSFIEHTSKWDFLVSQWLSSAFLPGMLWSWLCLALHITRDICPSMFGCADFDSTMSARLNHHFLLCNQ